MTETMKPDELTLGLSAAQAVQQAYILTFPDQHFRQGFHNRGVWIQDDGGRTGWAEKEGLMIIHGSTEVPWGFVKGSSRQGRKEIQIVFRGTVEPADWLRFNIPVGDFVNNYLRALIFEENARINVGLTRVTFSDERFEFQSGFAHAYLSIAVQVRELVESYAEFDEIVSLEIFGHSLGGAMAQICYCDFKAKSIKRNGGGKFPITLVSLAAPRGIAKGTVQEAFTGGDTLLRFEVDGDLVPKIPETGTRVDWMNWFFSGKLSPEPEKTVLMTSLGKQIKLWGEGLNPLVPKIFRYLGSLIRKADLLRVGKSRYPLHLIDFYQASITKGAPPSQVALTPETPVQGVRLVLNRRGGNAVTRKIRVTAFDQSQEFDWNMMLPSLQVNVGPTAARVWLAEHMREASLLVWADNMQGVDSIEASFFGGGKVLYSARIHTAEWVGMAREDSILLSPWPAEWQRPLLETGENFAIGNHSAEPSLYINASVSEIISSVRTPGTTSDLFYAKYDTTRNAYQIFSAASGQLLAVADPAQGSVLLEKEDKLKHNQYWRFLPAGDAGYFICPFANPRSAITLLYLDRTQSKVGLYPLAGSHRQVWKVALVQETP